MDHEAYENQMIDGVNRNAEEKSKHVETSSFEYTAKVIPLFTKRDSGILSRGFKCAILALVTLAAFAFSVAGFIITAMAPGYLAVASFIVSLLILGCAFILLYALGLICRES